MRFIGNKENLLEQIYRVVQKTNIKHGVFCDLFSGTANVGKFFKQKGYKIISSDLLYFSYVLQKAYIENNVEPKFSRLLPKLKDQPLSLFASPLQSVIYYLNSLEGVNGYIYQNYTIEGSKGSQFKRMFFTAENGRKIDHIRTELEVWKDKKLINDNEYYILLSCLIESVPFYANISGVYAAFLKTYDPRALKLFRLRPINIYKSELNHHVHKKDGIKLINNLNVDILYLDPPYNQRQYGANYHLLETIAKYDNPKISGVAGIRDYEDQKSDFCNRDRALEALNNISKKSFYKYLLLSYNSEGIMPQRDIMSILNKYGNLELVEINYRRFKSNSNGNSKNKKHIQEQLYLLNRT